MKKLLTILACILPLLAGCSASNEQAPTHFFWKVSDSNSSVYLLGSIHFADSSFFPLDSAIVNAFVRSEELAVEIDVTDDSVLQEVAMQSLQLGMLPEGMSLDSLLPDTLVERLDSVCREWNLPVGYFKGFTPWAAAMTLNSIGIMRLGFDGSLGIDLHFLNLAKESGKKVVPLETVEEQVFALTGKDASDEVALFLMEETLREIALMDSSIVWMMRAWKTGDDSLFHKALDLDEAPLSAADSLLKRDFEERVYYVRNREMAEKITAFLAEDRNVFVVVGAAHLVGMDDNVIDILRRKGFTVER